MRNRLAVYRTQTAPLLDWYAAKGLLVTVNGEGPIAEIGRRVQAAARGRV